MNIPQACNILLIDDLPDHVELIKLILSKYEDIVKVTATGMEGIEVAQQDPPDLIIVRLMLRDMDGYEICRRLKAIPVLMRVPILLFSARKSKGVYPEAQGCGAAGYLEQPYLPDELRAARNALLGGGTYYPSLSD